MDFVSSQEASDTSTPMGEAIFTIIGAMAELERKSSMSGSRTRRQSNSIRAAREGTGG